MTSARVSLRRAAGALATLALAATGLGADCSTTTPHEVAMVNLTQPPAGRVGFITEEDRDLDTVRAVKLTRGVALAVRCWDSCDYVCTEPTLTSADPTVADARVLIRPGQTGEMVLIGVRTGQTTLTLHSKCADKTYPIEVMADE